MGDELFFADVCVCCGVLLPEGEMICKNCKCKLSEQTNPLHNIKKSNKKDEQNRL